MNHRIIGAVVAVLLAAIGTFVLVAYVRAAEDRALAGERLVDVLVVQAAVPKGTKVDELGTRIGPKRVPVRLRAPGSVADLSALQGQVAAVNLLPGEQVLTERFEDPNVLAAGGDVEVPRGSQQVVISLQPQRALGGHIRPGDKVGFFASIEGQTHQILHKVLVTNVLGGPAQPTQGEQANQAAPTGDLLITLAVMAADAERIVFAAEHGTIWLSAEPPEAPEGGTRVQSKETIYQ